MKKFNVSLDASGLVVGRRYRFCVDVDGASTTIPFGDTSYFVLVSPITISSVKTIYQGLNQMLYLTCPSRCSVQSSGYLSYPDCDSTDNDGVHVGDATSTSSVMLEPQGNSIFKLTLNASHLTKGRQYKICIDVDGVNNDYFGDAGFKVYIAAVTNSGGTIHKATSQALSLTCAAAADCSTETQAYLSTSCDSTVTRANILGDGVHKTSSVKLTGIAPTTSWTATVDASSLQAGRLYKLCTDLDGDVETQVQILSPTATKPMPMGENLFYYYVSGVTALYHPIHGAVQAQALLRQKDQVITLICPSACANETSVYLTMYTCDTTDFTGNRAGQLLAESASVTLTPGSIASQWTATVDCSGLLPGQTFKVCVDIDGAGPMLAFGDAAVTAYITPIVSTPTKAIALDTFQKIVLICSSAYICTSTTMAYLVHPTELCDTSADGAKTGSGFINTQAAVVTGSGTTWTYDLHAINLLPGYEYRICVDLNGNVVSVVEGASVSLSFGYTGLEVYITPASDVQPRRLMNQAAQVVTVTCPNAGCGTQLRAYLTSEGACARTVNNGVMTALASVRTASTSMFQSGVAWQLSFDCDALEPGYIYTLCFDQDGPTTKVAFADTGFPLYVAGTMALIRGWSLDPWSTIYRVAGETLVLVATIGG
jgi:hypothetical protein